MADAYVLQSAGETAGIIVAEAAGMRFYASEARFYPLEGQLFASLDAARRAVDDQERARIAAAGRRSVFPYRRAA